MISEASFVKYIDKLKELNKIEDEINQVLKKLEFFSISFMNHESLIIEILEDAFDDKKNGWLCYFIYELNFGEKYKEGCITFNNIPVPMSNAKELYKVLVDNLNRKESN